MKQTGRMRGVRGHQHQRVQVDLQNHALDGRRDKGAARHHRCRGVSLGDAFDARPHLDVQKRTMIQRHPRSLGAIVKEDPEAADVANAVFEGTDARRKRTARCSCRRCVAPTAMRNTCRAP